MKNLLVTAGLGGFVGAVVAAGGLLFFAGNKGAGNMLGTATINLDMVNGQCHINTDPQTIQARKSQNIEWTIVDRCGVTQTADVEVIFRGGNDPFEVACVKKGKKKIKCKIKGDATVGSRKYDVVAGTALPEDPELEIVQ